MEAEIEKIVKAIRRVLPDARIILFGSRARGDALRTSDIDLIIVSRAFNGTPFPERPKKILRILWQAKALPHVDVDVLCYTPEEFERKKRELGIVREAVSYGVEL